MEQIIIETREDIDFIQFAEMQIREHIIDSPIFFWESIGGDEWAVFTQPEDDDAEYDDRSFITVRRSYYDDQELLIIEF